MARACILLASWLGVVSLVSVTPVFAAGAAERAAPVQVHEPDLNGRAAEHGPHPENQTRAVIILAVFCLMVIPASLLGGWLPFVIELTHTRIQLMISLVGGLMLGIGLFHMLPHAVAEMGPGSLDTAIGWMMAGLLSMFFLIRAFHFHQHGPTERADLPPENREHARGADHAHHPDHDHGHPAHRHARRGKSARLSWAGVTFGLAVHTLLDGVALAASVQADADHGGQWSLYGLGTFLAVILHKPLDAVSITSLMTADGWPVRWRHAVNAGFALMCPLGAMLFFFGAERFSGHQAVVVGCALAFSAGVFVCISLSDLLPELELHSHDRVKLSFALLLGIAVAYGIGYLEPEHAHVHAAGDHAHDHHPPQNE